MWAAEAKAKRNIPIGKDVIPKDSIITITKGIESDYILWHSKFLWTLNKRYVKDIKVINNQ